MRKSSSSPTKGWRRMGIVVVLVFAVAGCSPFLPGVGQKERFSADDDVAPSVRGVTVAGTVIAAESGLPLKNASVAFGSGEPVPVTEGQFEFADVRPGRYTLRVTAPYHRAQTVDVVVEGEDVFVDVRLSVRFSDRELYDLASIVRAEAEGEPLEGQVAVAASVLNRWASPAYPDNLSEIVYQVTDGYYQYSPVLDGRIRLGPNESAWQAVFAALAGDDPSAGATGFFAHDKVGAGSWVRRHPVTARIHNHTFFRYP